jgi:uncharacterized protein (TIGR03083 family)
MSLRPPTPVDAAELFAPDRAALLDLLAGLTEEEWARPTACPGWSVGDVARHVLAGDLGNLSRRRDRFRGPAPAPGESIAGFVNRINDEWMRAARRLSPRVLVDLLAAAGPPLFAYFGSLDPTALGPPVSWAGPGPAPVWLDVAREYTERWHHQQHVRDAVGRPGQTEPRFLHPVLATFVHALPVAFGAVDAPYGASVHLHVRGEAGGDWSVVRQPDGWRLYAGAPDAPNARVALDQDRAWRLFTRGLTSAQAARAAALEGDRRLAEPLLRAVAII